MGNKCFGSILRVTIQQQRSHSRQSTAIQSQILEREGRRRLETEIPAGSIRFCREKNERSAKGTCDYLAVPPKDGHFILDFRMLLGQEPRSNPINPRAFCNRVRHPICFFSVFLLRRMGTYKFSGDIDASSSPESSPPLAESPMLRSVLSLLMKLSALATVRADYPPEQWSDAMPYRAMFEASPDPKWSWP
jgi:hypothetical protein